VEERKENDSEQEKNCKKEKGDKWLKEYDEDKKRRQENNRNKMGLKEIGRDCVDWIHMAQDKNPRWALLNDATQVRVP
jgi:hypothetical protein